MGRFLEWIAARRAERKTEDFRVALEQKNLKKIFKFLEAGFDPNHVYQVEQLRTTRDDVTYSVWIDKTPLDMVWDDEVSRLLCAYGAMRSYDFFRTPKGEEYLRLRKEERQRREAESCARSEAEYRAREEAKKKEVDKLLAKRKRH